MDAQKIAWVKRARAIDDWWKIALSSRCYGTIFNIRSTDFDPRKELCLRSIVSSYERFLVSYTKLNENFKDSYIFDNTALTMGLRDNRKFNKNNFTPGFFRAYGERLKKLTIRDLLRDEVTAIHRDEFIRRTNIPIPFLTFQALIGVLETARVKYGKVTTVEKESLDITTFINRSKKGSKRYRVVLNSVTQDYIPHNIVKFSRNVDTVIGLKESKTLNTLWTMGWFSNATKTFLFKLYNNTLGYNNAVAHFVRGHSLNCTFCDVAGNQEITDETPLHLFFQCEQVEGFIENIFKWATNDENFTLTRK